jgi:hypothetical protein
MKCLSCPTRINSNCVAALCSRCSRPYQDDHGMKLDHFHFVETGGVMPKPRLDQKERYGEIHS